jgi:formylglycine-generating enzyme
VKLVGLVVGAIGLLASAVGLYEALAPPDRSVHKLILRTAAKIRPSRTSDIRTLISTYNFAPIPSGTFRMGTDPRVAPAQKAFSDEFPPHSVTVSYSLFVGRRLVTQRLWEALMGTSLRDRYAANSGPNHPIVGISWFEAIRFCNEISYHAGLIPAYSFSDPLAIEPTVIWDRAADGFRLPTEAEWEYVARAGTTSPFWSGYSSSELNAAEWTGDNTDHLRDVGLRSPNPWGLYDMNGLVGEWCWDWYGPYDASDSVDPSGPSYGSGRVWRGGRWIWKKRPEYYRSADRDQMLPVNNDSAVGFRLVRSPRTP